MPSILRRFQSPGFTVFEILVVIGIFTLLTALAIPLLNRFQPNLKLDGVARELTADLRYAQQLTITEQKSYSIILNPVTNNYRLVKNDDGTILKSVLLPGDIFFTASTTVTNVQFNSYGGVVSASIGQIQLKNTSNTAQNIDIKPSGYVEITN